MPFDIDGVDVNLRDFLTLAQDIRECKAISSSHLKPGITHTNCLMESANTQAEL